MDWCLLLVLKYSQPWPPYMILLSQLLTYLLELQVHLCVSLSDTFCIVFLTSYDLLIFCYVLSAVKSSHWFIDFDSFFFFHSRIFIWFFPKSLKNHFQFPMKIQTLLLISLNVVSAVVLGSTAAHFSVSVFVVAVGSHLNHHMCLVILHRAFLSLPPRVGGCGGDWLDLSFTLESPWMT